jgi:phosphohistidine phosphatase
VATDRRLQFWLLRHAKTATDPPAGGTDHDRVLTPRGRRDATRLGRRLGPEGKGLGVDGVVLPQLVLCSTAARTVQTAELVLGALSEPPELSLTRVLYVASPEGVLDVLRLVDDGIRSVMVVGHNPTAHQLAGDLLDRKDADGLDQVEKSGVPTCALAVYRLPARRWAEVRMRSARLLGLWTPPY